MASKRSRARRLTFIIFTSIFLSITYFFIYQPRVLSQRQSSAIPYRDDSITCPKSSLLDDVFVVLRTGATETQEKIPVHFKTILACVPDFVIYSDMDEVVDGHQVYDVLNEMNATVQSMAPEFELYRHLKTRGRDGLDYQTSNGGDPVVTLDSSGLKLDKWKFLPMIDKAVQQRPKASWYVFIEADTYMVWTNMLEYLSRLDHKHPYYIGRHMYHKEVLYGHGGSGFVLSRPAAQKVSKYWKRHETELDLETLKGWVGDFMLGKVMKKLDIPLLWGYPHFQGDSLTAIDWAIEKLERQTWCYAAMTFHHMSPSDFTMLWQFEQLWHQRNPAKSALRFRDIFHNLIRHRLRDERDEWDNISTGHTYSKEALDRMSEDRKDSLTLMEQNAHHSLEMCKATCHAKPDCIQFSFQPGICSLSDQLRLGHPAESQCVEYSNAAGKCIKAVPVEKDTTVRSGWMMDRVPRYAEKLDKLCDNPEGNDWILA
ncbi:glycosyltransferase family 31 protein [Xylariaceae sp. FL1019]|nr:glycosyltransferase family 31 protein [Xylariaceae sp. FL1019]